MVEKIAKIKKGKIFGFFLIGKHFRGLIGYITDRYTHLTQKPGIKGAVYPLLD